MFQIDETNLLEDVKDFLEDIDTYKAKRYKWSLFFKLPDGEDIQPIKVHAIDILRDYGGTAYGDQVRIAVDLMVGEYKKYIYPHRENLHVEIVREEIDFDTGGIDVDQAPTSSLYKAIPVDQVNLELEGNLDSYNQDDLNSIVRSFEFDMLNPTVDYLRQTHFSLALELTTNENALKTLYTYFGKSVPVDKDYLIKGVDIVESNSEKIHRHLVIPKGTKILSLHKWLQLHKGGIYNSGITSYIQDRTWYVFPTFNTRRYDTSTKKLLIVNVPPKKFPQLDLTYLQLENHLLVISNGEVKVHDDSELLELNLGNGLMYADSEKIREGFSVRNGNQGIITRSSNIKRYGVRERSDNKKFVPFSDEPITSNHPKQMSKLTRRNGLHLELTISNSDPDLMYPGQPVKILYLNGDDLDEIKEKDGVLIKADHSVTNIAEGPNGSQFVCNSIITVFAERD